MTTPAEELRAAATKLRQLATAAATGRSTEPTARWAFTELCFDSGKGWGSGMLRAIDGLDADADPHLGQALIHGSSGSRGRAPSLAAQHGAYIATMEPTVGLALADWLDATARTADDEGAAFLDEALAVARQLLGTTP